MKNLITRIRRLPVTMQFGSIVLLYFVTKLTLIVAGLMVFGLIAKIAGY